MFNHSSFRALLCDHTFCFQFLYKIYPLPLTALVSLLLIDTLSIYFDFSCLAAPPVKFVGGVVHLQKGTKNATSCVHTLRQRDKASSAKSWLTVVRQPTENLVVTAEECENVTWPEPASKLSSSLSWPIIILRGHLSPRGHNNMEQQYLEEHTSAIQLHIYWFFLKQHWLNNRHFYHCVFMGIEQQESSN